MQGKAVKDRIFVAGGFAEVTRERCTVLAEEAMPVAELDRARDRGRGSSSPREDLAAGARMPPSARRAERRLDGRRGQARALLQQRRPVDRPQPARIGARLQASVTIG